MEELFVRKQQANGETNEMRMNEKKRREEKCMTPWIITVVATLQHTPPHSTLMSARAPHVPLCFVVRRLFRNVCCGCASESHRRYSHNNNNTTLETVQQRRSCSHSSFGFFHSVAQPSFTCSCCHAHTHSIYVCSILSIDLEDFVPFQILAFCGKFSKWITMRPRSISPNIVSPLDLIDKPFTRWIYLRSSQATSFLRQTHATLKCACLKFSIVFGIWIDGGVS